MVHKRRKAVDRVIKFPGIDMWLKYKAAMYKLSVGKYWTSEIDVGFDNSRQFVSK